MTRPRTRPLGLSATRFHSGSGSDPEDIVGLRVYTYLLLDMVRAVRLGSLIIVDREARSTESPSRLVLDRLKASSLSSMLSTLGRTLILDSRHD